MRGQHRNMEDKIYTDDDYRENKLKHYEYPNAEEIVEEL